MSAAVPLLVSVSAVVFLTIGTQAQSAAPYRDDQLGADLSSVSVLAGLKASDATLVHERPAVMRDLPWKPNPYTVPAKSPSDPVEHQGTAWPALKAVFPMTEEVWTQMIAVLTAVKPGLVEPTKED